MEFKLNTGSSIKRPFPDPHYALPIGVSRGLNFLKKFQNVGCRRMFGYFWQFRFVGFNH